MFADWQSSLAHASSLNRFTCLLDNPCIYLLSGNGRYKRLAVGSSLQTRTSWVCSFVSLGGHCEARSNLVSGCLHRSKTSDMDTKRIRPATRLLREGLAMTHQGVFEKWQFFVKVAVFRWVFWLKCMPGVVYGSF